MLQHILNLRYGFLLIPCGAFVYCLLHEPLRFDGDPPYAKPKSRILGAAEQENLNTPSLTETVSDASPEVIRAIIRSSNKFPPAVDGKEEKEPLFVRKCRRRGEALSHASRFAEVYWDSDKGGMASDAPALFSSACALAKLEFDMLSAVSKEDWGTTKTLLARYDSRREAADFLIISNSHVDRRASAFSRWRAIDAGHPIQQLQKILHSWISGASKVGSVDGGFSIPAWSMEDDRQVKQAVGDCESFLAKYEDIDPFAGRCRKQLQPWKQALASVKNINGGHSPPEQIRDLTRVLDILELNLDEDTIRKARRAALTIGKTHLPFKGLGKDITLANSSGEWTGERSLVSIRWVDSKKGQKGYTPLFPAYDEFKVMDDVLKREIKDFEYNNEHYRSLLPTRASERAYVFNNVLRRWDGTVDFDGVLSTLVELREIVRRDMGTDDELVLRKINDLVAALTDLKARKAKV